MIQAALPVFRAQRGGAIANISSLGGQLSFAGFSAYSATKFALEGLSEALAQEVAPFGVKVLIVEPGPFRTDFAGPALRHMPILEPYRDIVGGARAFASGMNATQEGDPAKAAAAVDAALNAAETPLRLQLGRDAVNAVRAHAERLLDQMKIWESVALDTAFDEAAS
jgi:NAD(P)-dependent dehydrogenase (short-subunit alcohol dehydrogenase family)